MIEHIGNQVVKRAYVGFQTSGLFHLGHYPLLKKLSSFGDDVHKIILLADVHGRINQKKDMLAAQIQWIKKVLPTVSIVVGSNILTDPLYWSMYGDLCSKVNLNQVLRGLTTQAKGSLNVGSTLMSHLNYSVWQSLDPHYLDVDLVLAGKDQRNIYFVGYDHYKSLNWKKPNFMFYPLIDLNGRFDGDKMGKSSSCIYLDRELYDTSVRALEGVPTFFDHFLSTQILQLTDSKDRRSFLQDLKDFLSPLIIK